MVANLPGVRVGLSCTLSVRDQERGEVETYSSRVEDLDEGRLLVAWPTRRGVPVPVETGEPVTLRMVTGPGDTLFLNCEVVERIPESAGNPIAMLALRAVAVGQQQREHFRLAISIQPIDCVLWERPFGAAEGEGNWRPIHATITDISASGVGLIVHDTIERGARLRVRFPYPMGEGEFTGDAVVRFAAPLTGSGGQHYKVGAAFEGVEAARRERLARCIHRFQIEERRRGRGRA
jgi:c-di-GMP-binding flagellar brake protein YcgR